ncbi:MAG TPA: 16S rRNA (cytosine(1402)-N(4))-methyltransferase RsmH [Bryobacteraceae bacterium]|nr:16S rRNA (cytosine(1402)-N(4))-methyltransferase RsmH [Bryobacteraceae bacterium]
MEHHPVMLAETLDYLAPQPAGVYLDATAGLGGHTRAIAERLTDGFVIANDRDAESLAIARRNVGEQLARRVRFHRGAFSTLPAALAEAGVERVDGLLADLGVSRYQLTDAERGFSLMAEGPLDMRQDRSQAATAADIVNFAAEKELADLIFQLGEERRSRRIARAIVRARPIRTTGQLARVVEEAVPRTGRLHPATQTFMALRLAVNDEMGELDRLLATAPNLVRSGGRMVVITFMSLEDRRVKQKFQELARAGRAIVLTKHVVRPGGAETEANPASRSAKLRAVEMTKANG